MSPLLVLRTTLLASVLASVLTSWAAISHAETGEPASLHAEIDQMLRGDSAADLATDATFLRRVYLDLWGTIPSASSAREFLADESPGKRTELIDRLLQSPRFASHMADVFDVMLMERLAQKHIKLEEWKKFLYDSFYENKSWKQLAAEILGADGTEEKVRPATRFYLAREGDPNRITRDVGRIFFGMDLQCCQCHDHPLIPDYYQSDYYGIYAFFNRGYLFTATDKKVFYAEKAEGDVAFTSVFTEENGTTLPRLPGGYEVREPRLLKGEDYEVPPASKQRAIPKYSRRALLAELVSKSPSRSFEQNVVNRLWTHMMGVGLVLPVDLHHPGNPAKHPQLLDVLARRFAAMDYDIREFLRQLALSKTYQRTVAVPEMTVGRIEPEVVDAARQLVATAQTQRNTLKQKVSDLESAVEAIDQEIAPLAARFAELNVKVGDARKSAEKTKKSYDDAVTKLTGKRKLADALSAAAQNAQQAAEQLSSDEKLIAAAKTFAARAATFTEEVAKLEKAVSDAKAPADETAAALVEARKNALDVVAQIDQLQEQRMGALSPLLAAKEEFHVAEVAWVDAQQQLASQEELFEIQQRQRNLLRLQNELRDSNVAAVTAEERVSDLSAQIAAKEPFHKDAVRVRTASQQQAEDLQSQQQNLKQALDLVAISVREAEAVAESLKDDAEFNKAKDQVKARQTELQQELQELGSQVKSALEQLKQAEELAGELSRELESWRQELTVQSEIQNQSRARLPKLEQQIAAVKTEVERDRSAWEELAESRLWVAGLKPLTPEQLAWSAMQATGVIAQHEPAVQAEVEKLHPLPAGQEETTAELAEQRRRAAVAALHNKLKGSVDAFVKLFAHGAGQPQSDFFATVDQALFVANSDTVLGWLNPSGENLVGRLSKFESSDEIADELYLSILTRYPGDDERQLVREYLTERESDRAAALKEMAWALLSSVEFRFQ